MSAIIESVRRGVLLLVLLLASLASAAPAAADGDADVDVDGDVVAAVRRLWTSEETPAFVDVVLLRERRQAALAALEQPGLWPAQPPGTVRWTLPAPDGQTQSVLVRIPAGYTPERAYPLVIGLHGTGGTAQSQMSYVTRVLDMAGASDTAIAVTVDSVQRGPFAGSPQEIGQAVALLPALSRRLRIDFTRLKVVGYSKGGHSSFANAVLHGDWWSAAMPVAGSWTVGPFWSKNARLLLPNLAGQTVQVVYGEHDTGGSPFRKGGGSKNKLTGITALNRHVKGLLSGWSRSRRGLKGLKTVRFQELAGKGHGDNWPGKRQLAYWWDARRPAQGAREGRKTRRWRYPPESWLDGIRCARLEGRAFDPRAKVQLRPKRGQSGDDALYDYMDVRFGTTTVEWKRDRNRVDVRTTRCAELEVWLSADALDFDKPIELWVDGTKRFSGQVTPDPAQLIHWLRLTGDTSRKMEARLLVRGKGRAVLNPATPPRELARYP